MYNSNFRLTKLDFIRKLRPKRFHKIDSRSKEKQFRGLQNRIEGEQTFSVIR
jgi:hypothetical protein